MEDFITPLLWSTLIPQSVPLNFAKFKKKNTDTEVQFDIDDAFAMLSQ